MNKTPNSNRIHIGIFGKTNAGKSSLINLITDQEAALVSEVRGTTTDPVYKAMEIKGIGPCVFIDTAGFSDESELGKKREEKTEDILDKTDIAIILFDTIDTSFEKEWIEKIKKRDIPILPIINKADVVRDINSIKEFVKENIGVEPISIVSTKKIYRHMVINELLSLIPPDFLNNKITSHLVKEGDSVLLVMPQDIQAPEGRLILPQVQTIRDLLDNRCIITCCVKDNYIESLNKLKDAPDLIITDSQIFKYVFDNKPKRSRLTSFSALLARHKGDIFEYVKGAAKVDELNENSKILIAEACTHAPLKEDIGREQIPKMIKNKFGDKIEIDVVSGKDYPKDLEKYDLIIHCGGCMFNRRYVLSRIYKAKKAGVAITNYGIFIAKMKGILKDITY